MTTHIGWLRAINLAGHQLEAIAELRELEDRQITKIHERNYNRTLQPLDTTLSP